MKPTFSTLPFNELSHSFLSYIIASTKHYRSRKFVFILGVCVSLLLSTMALQAQALPKECPLFLHKVVNDAKYKSITPANLEEYLKSAVILVGFSKTSNYTQITGSGVLVNNSQQDGTLYVLTASHIIDAFDFQKNVLKAGFLVNCSDPGSCGLFNDFVEAEVVYNSRKTDIALLKFKVAGDNLDAYLAGWDVSQNVTPDNGIHFGDTYTPPRPQIPRPQFLKIDHVKDLEITIPGKEKVVMWEAIYATGCVGEGSSGSPLFDQQGNVVGILSMAGGFQGKVASYQAYTKLKDVWLELRPYLDPDGKHTQLDGASLNCMVVQAGAKAKKFYSQKLNLLYDNIHNLRYIIAHGGILGNVNPGGKADLRIYNYDATKAHNKGDKLLYYAFIDRSTSHKTVRGVPDYFHVKDAAFKSSSFVRQWMPIDYGARTSEFPIAALSYARYKYKGSKQWPHLWDYDGKVLEVVAVLKLTNASCSKVKLPAELSLRSAVDLFAPNTYASCNLQCIENCGKNLPDETVTGKDNLSTKGDGDVAIFPNPFKDVLNMALEMPGKAEVKVVLYNLSGIQLYVEKFLLDKGKQTIELHEYKNLTAGMYILELQYLGGTKQYKVLKE